MRRTVTLCAAILLATTAPMTVSAAEVGVQEPSDEVVVRYRADTSRGERRAVARDHDLTVVHTSGDGRVQTLRAVGRSPLTIRRNLAQDPRVAQVARNSYRTLADDVSDEEFFPYLWGIDNRGRILNGVRGTPDVDVDAYEALQLQMGSPEVVVAVIDDGAQVGNTDLGQSVWSNPGESGTAAYNGIDDDGNGYVDDARGWNFCDGNADVNPKDPDGAFGQPPDSHGTHVAGTIGGRHDRRGVVGVAPGVKIMVLQAFRFGTACGAGDGTLAEAIDYAASFAVPIINASWGGPLASSVLDGAIADSQALFVAAAGNAGRDIDAPGKAYYPASSTLPNVLTVTAVDSNGRLPAFANRGRISVDIAAPGVDILSIVPPRYGCEPVCYGWSSGTSMAVPHVAGVAALALSGTSEALAPEDLKARILSTGTPLASLATTTLSGKLANAWRLVDRTGPTASAIDRHGINVGAIVGSTVSTTLAWPPATDTQSAVASYVVRRRIGTGGWSILASASTARTFKYSMPLATSMQFGIAGRDAPGNVGPQAVADPVEARLFQEGTSLARYGGTWSSVASSSASGGKLRTTTRAGASVQFATTARAIAVVGRKGPGRGQAKVYVDGVYVQTIDFNRSSLQSRVVVWSRSWSTPGTHAVKLVVVGTAGRPRVDIDGFAILR